MLPSHQITRSFNLILAASLLISLVMATPATRVQAGPGAAAPVDKYTAVGGIIGTTPSLTGLTSSINPAFQGQVVTLIASVSPEGVSTDIPSGQVVFALDGTPVYTSTLYAGQVSWSTTTLPVGTHSIVAVYLGDAIFNTSSSVPFSQKIEPSLCYATSDDGATVFSQVQPAVEAAPEGGVVKIAGACQGVYDPLGWRVMASITQTMTLRGGYTTTNWTVSDPAANPTSLDALQEGQVIVIQGPARVKIVNLALQNGSSDTDGGGILAYGADVSLEGVTLQFNDAHNSGGGAMVLGSLALTDTQVLSNTAQASGDPILSGGGGVYVTGSLSTWSGRFQGNNFFTPSGGGGGACVDNAASGQVSIHATQFDGNAAMVGGGLFTTGPATLVDPVFSNNLAMLGGAVLVGNIVGPIVPASILPELHLTGGVLRQNLGMYAGALIAGGPAFITDTLFLQNGSYLYGGGAATIQDLYLTGGRFEENVAGIGAPGFGGGLADLSMMSPITTTPTIFITGTVFISNTSSYMGGGFFSFSKAALVNTAFISNTAVLSSTMGDGGGAYLSTGGLLLNSRFEVNQAGGRGGGLYSGGSTAITGTQFISNSAGDNGGGAYIQGDVAPLADSTFTANHIASLTPPPQPKAGRLLSAQRTFSRLSRSLPAGWSLDSLLAKLGLKLPPGSFLAGKSAQLLMDDGMPTTHAAALYLAGGTLTSRLVNNLFIRNRPAFLGSDVVLGTGTGQAFILHNTLANLDIDPGAGTAITSRAVTGTVGITNNIIANYAAGIRVIAGDLNEDYNLFSSVSVERVGFLTSGGHSFEGYPEFINPEAGDFHIAGSSIALDGGAFAGVLKDKDGRLRPTNPNRPDAPDAGAYENKDLQLTRYFTGDPFTFGAGCGRITLINLEVNSLSLQVIPGVFPTKRPSDEIVRRYFYISTDPHPADWQPGSSATVSLCYEPEELNGLDESQLKLYRWNGTSWDGLDTTVDTANHMVTATGVTGFSPWVIGGPVKPTDLHLASFQGRSLPFAALPAGLCVILLGLGLGMLLVGGRKRA